MRALNTITLILLIVGGLNWGLVAIHPDYDLVASIGGGMQSWFAKVVYIIVALCALYQLFMIGPVSRAETYNHDRRYTQPARV